MPDDNPYASPSESDPLPEPSQKFSTVAKFRLGFLAISVLGFMIIVAGFIYWMEYAGLPYQDPTPEMRQQYRESDQIASLIMSIGFYIAWPSTIAFVVLLFIKLKPK